MKKESNYFDSHFFQFDKIKNHLNSLDTIPQRISYLEWLKNETKEIYTCYNQEYEVKEKDFENFDDMMNHIKEIQDKILNSVKGKIQGKQMLCRNHTSDIGLEPSIYRVSCHIGSLEPLIKFIDEKIDFWKTQLLFQKQYLIENKQTSIEKILWKKEKRALVFLINELIKGEFIKGNKNLQKMISQHFTLTDSEIKTSDNSNLTTEKILWKKDKKDLVFLIYKLIELKFIAGYNFNKIILQHFTWTDSEINPIEISDLKSKLKNKTYPLNPSHEIEEIITKMENQF